MRLSTQLHRSLFALPLLSIGLLAATSPEACPQSGLEACLPVPVPALNVAAIANIDCAEPARTAGTRALARMPGDIGAFGRRLRCAS